MAGGLVENGSTRAKEEERKDLDAQPSQESNGASEMRKQPPKPVPFGSSTASVGNDGRVASECSRQGLRRDVAKRRHTLTPQEHGFLEMLAIHGEEIEVELAREKLLDENVFFDHSSESPPEGGGGTIESGNSAKDEGNTGRLSDRIPEDIDLHRRAGEGETSVSSTRRLEHLEARKNSELHGKMWRAHESGIAVSSGASRRSVLRREKSASSRRKRTELVRNNSFLSTATQDLLLQGGPSNRPGENDIFRSSAKAVKSASSRNRSVSMGTLPQLTLTRPSRNSLRRLRSEEGGRKSVTFRDDTYLGGDNRESGPGRVRRMSQPDLGAEDGTFVPMPPPRGIADRRISEVTIGSFDDDDFEENGERTPSNSVASFPSLHHGHPIRSNSISSIPSIHRGHPLRSDSISSIPSIHHGHPIRADSMSSIPSIHHGRPVRSDSVFSNASSISGILQTANSSGSEIPSPSPEVASEWLNAKTKTEKPNDPAWTAPSPQKLDVPSNGQLARHPAQAPEPKPVLLRRASVNEYAGEGIEASDWQDNDSSFLIDSLENARNYRSMVSMGSVYASSSFDETKSSNRNQVFRSIATSISDDDLSLFFLGRTTSPTQEGSSTNEVRVDNDEGEASWDLDNDTGHYDAWNVLKDEYAVEYDVSVLPFRILGTSADDVASHPHVLSPPILESLQNFLPYGVSEENFWMKFSLIRDGASLHTLLQNVRASRHTILALETADGEVFGSFTSTTWRKNWGYFGSGESFLWRMRQSRMTPCHSIIDQAHLESELDVYPWTGENDSVQLCTHNKIAFGSGSPNDDEDEINDRDYGFGLAIDADLMHGTSSPCATFGSPSLSQVHDAGERFEIMNIEMWTLTPCMTVAHAEKLELGKLFLETG